MRKLAFVLGLPIALLLGLSAAGAAGEYGTPAEAKAMLEKAVAELKKDKAAALEKFTKKEGAFGDKDLYVYCGGPDGNFTAHPSLVGKSLKGLEDKATPPKALGAEVYASAAEGKISEVSYMWPRPGEEKPSEKVAYVTKAGDQVCGVGYYKP
jgi:hypothetical protein